MGNKLCMEVNFARIKLREENSSVNLRFLLWLSGPENFSGPSRNGPLDRCGLEIPEKGGEGILYLPKCHNRSKITN